MPNRTFYNEEVEQWICELCMSEYDDMQSAENCCDPELDEEE